MALFVHTCHGMSNPICQRQRAEDGEDDAVAVIHGEKPDTDYAKIDFVQSSAMELPEAVATSEAMPPILGPDGQPLPHMTRLVSAAGICERGTYTGCALTFIS